MNLRELREKLFHDLPEGATGVSLVGGILIIYLAEDSETIRQSVMSRIRKEAEQDMEVQFRFLERPRRTSSRTAKITLGIIGILVAQGLLIERFFSNKWYIVVSAGILMGTLCIFLVRRLK